VRIEISNTNFLSRFENKARINKSSSSTFRPALSNLWLLLVYLLNAFVFQKVALKPGGLVYNEWVNTTIPVYMQYFVFHLVNPEDVFQGKAVPTVKQMGPYSYRYVSMLWTLDNPCSCNTFNFHLGIKKGQLTQWTFSFLVALHEVYVIHLFLRYFVFICALWQCYESLCLTDSVQLYFQWKQLLGFDLVKYEGLKCCNHVFVLQRNKIKWSAQLEQQQ